MERNEFENTLHRIAALIVLQNKDRFDRISKLDKENQEFAFSLACREGLWNCGESYGFHPSEKELETAVRNVLKGE